MTNFYAAGIIIIILQVKKLQLLKTEELDQGHRHLEPGWTQIRQMCTAALSQVSALPLTET